MIVIGGTPQQTSNRMEELATELSQAPEEFVEQFKESLELGIPTIKANLEAWHNLNYHLVGSRDYVYQSLKMIKVIEHLEKVAESDWRIGKYALTHYHGGNCLPRTYGFREAVITHLVKGE